MAEDSLGISSSIVFCEGFFFLAVPWLERQGTVPCFEMLSGLPVLSISAITAGKVLI